MTTPTRRAHDYAAGYTVQVHQPNAFSETFGLPLQHYSQTSRHMKQTVTLPWPHRDLSPNARIHWARKAKAVKGYRLACAWHAAEQKIQKMRPPIDAKITFHPPDARRRDLDNMLASLKACLDALSDAIGVDDSKWTLALVRGEPRPKQGAIEIELEAA